LSIVAANIQLLGRKLQEKELEALQVGEVLVASAGVREK